MQFVKFTALRHFFLYFIRLKELEMFDLEKRQIRRKMGVVFKQLQHCHVEKGIWLLLCSPSGLHLCVEFIGRQISVQFKEELSYQSDLLRESASCLGREYSFKVWVG